MPSNRIVYGASTWDFISIGSHPDLPGMNLKTIKRTGVSGRAYKEMDFDAEPTPIYLRAHALNFADAMDWIANMKNLQGTQVTLWDSTGQPYSGVVIESMRHTMTQAVTTAVWLGASLGAGYRLNFSAVVTYPYGSF